MYPVPCGESRVDDEAARRRWIVAILNRVAHTWTQGEAPPAGDSGRRIAERERDGVGGRDKCAVCRGEATELEECVGERAIVGAAYL